MNREQYKQLRSLRSKLRAAEVAVRRAERAVEKTRDDKSPFDLWLNRERAYGYRSGLQAGLTTLETALSGLKGFLK